MFACAPAKYAEGFKQTKKEIDTLSILPLFAHIIANNYQIEHIASTLIRANQQHIDSLTFNLLSKKYTLEKVELPAKELNVFSEVFSQLEESPKTLSKISSKPLFDVQHLTAKNRYVLLMVYFAQINPDYPPHYKLNSAMVSNTIVITPNNPTRAFSDLRLLIIDTEKEQIVFYDRIESSKFDARVPGEVEQMTRKILRKVYYK